MFGEIGPRDGFGFALKLYFYVWEPGGDLDSFFAFGRGSDGPDSRPGSKGAQKVP